MRSFHIHISGIVQGVGFRPMVCQQAEHYGLQGWVRNGNDGVHIQFNATQDEAERFYREIIARPPTNALITDHEMTETGVEVYSGFLIIESSDMAAPDLLITPDLALCPQCRKELQSLTGRRSGYVFTTCLNCGPRYSIITALPYDRSHTSMAELLMCPECAGEYADHHDRRHHSQTNSCPHCTIPIHLFDRPDHEIDEAPENILSRIARALQSGGIVAVKGTGGYLLLADATDAETIRTLRQRKHRPAKPFALLYRDRDMMKKDAVVSDLEYAEMSTPVAPIVLCPLTPTCQTGMHHDLIAPGLDKIGIMLPNNALLQRISDMLDRPLICTSANLSGSPIIYRDDEARHELFRFAQLLLTYDRDIQTPQDDSVLQFSRLGQKIILRRSRGLAPNFHPQSLAPTAQTILAMGADMKGSFAVQHRDKVFVGQYLGDQSEYAAQAAHAQARAHICSLMHWKPDMIVTDAHPEYASTTAGRALATHDRLPIQACQHHHAHFAALLGEYGMLDTKEAVLGFIWDGTGFGDDGQIWGSETLLFDNGAMTRVAHLRYFPHWLSDKMSREPRLSALSLMKDAPSGMRRLEKFFSQKEWHLYTRPAFLSAASTQTCSMGRFLDGISALLTGCTMHRFEGEAVILLETLARQSAKTIAGDYELPLTQGNYDTTVFLQQLLKDLDNGCDPAAIADKVFRSLARMIFATANSMNISTLAFSGGVFQNALLVDHIQSLAPSDMRLLFHERLSPNDENIAFGQLVLHQLNTGTKENAREKAFTETILKTSNY